MSHRIIYSTDLFKAANSFNYETPQRVARKHNSSAMDLFGTIFVAKIEETCD